MKAHPPEDFNPEPIQKPHPHHEFCFGAHFGSPPLAVLSHPDFPRSYAALALFSIYCYKWRQRQDCFYSVEQLMAMTGLSRRSVQTANASLRDSKFVWFTFGGISYLNGQPKHYANSVYPGSRFSNDAFW